MLARERNQPDAVLHLTGRDVEEQTLALRFAPASGAWTLLGTANERQHSQARQDILDLLRERGAMTPAEIAKELGKAQGTTRAILHRMGKDRLIQKSQSGLYELTIEADQERENQAAS